VLTVVDQVVFAGTQSFGGFSTVTTASGEDITTLRFGGPLPDSNFWGRHLIMGLPLAAALSTHALRSGRRLAATGWGLAILALLAGIYLTQSRGTFVSAAVAIVLWFIASGHTIRRRGLASLPLAVGALAVPGIGNRLAVALQDLTHAQANGHIDPSVLGRLAAQQQAGLMWEERPYFGFGPATFPGQVIHFAGRVPMAVREPTNAPHNLYVEFAAESGVTGVFGWLVLILGFVTVVVLAIIARPHSRDRVLVAAVLAAIVGWSAASIGLHMAYFRTLGVVLALAVGLAPAWPVPAEVLRIYRHGVAVWLAALGVGLSTLWLYVTVNSSPAVTATQHMTLVPVGPVDGWYSYALDIRSRIEFLPTFAILLQDQKSPVDIEADPVRGLLTFTTTADTMVDARDDLQLAVAHAGSLLHQSIGYEQYSLETVGSMRVEPKQVHSRLVPFIGGGVGIGVAMLGGLVLSRLFARRRSDRPLAETPVPQGVS